MVSTDDPLEQRIARLESLLSGPRDLAEDVPYRPALWQQNWKYAAIDDRSLIAATCWPGVIGPGHLRVHPRDEGPNLSVDVDPGIVCVPGEEEYLSRFICPLKWKVNLPITQGPAAGSQRYDTVIALVTEVEGTEEATWELQVVPGPVRPAGQIEHPPLPRSSFGLAWVGPITTATTSIGAGNIGDWRRRGNAAPLSGVLTRLMELPGPDASGSSLGWNQWGPVQSIIVPPNLTLDVVSTLIGDYASGDHNQGGNGYMCVEISLDSGASWRRGHHSPTHSPHIFDWRSLSVAHAVSGTAAGPFVMARALTTVVDTRWMRLFGGTLTTTITPASVV